MPKSSKNALQIEGSTAGVLICGHLVKLHISEKIGLNAREKHRSAKGQFQGPVGKGDY